MTDDKKNETGKDTKVVKKFFLRLFVTLVAAVLFTSWFLVGLKKINFVYAMWISLGVVVSWIIVMVLYAISDKSFRSNKTGKPYVAEEMGVLSAIPREEDSENSDNA